MQGIFDVLTQEFLIRCLIGFSVGGLIGFERQKKEDETSLGVRTFGLSSFIGFIASYVMTIEPGFSTQMIFIFASIAIISVMILKANHALTKEDKHGITTFLVLVISYILGSFVGIDVVMPGEILGRMQSMAIMASFIIFMILSIKDKIAIAVESVSRKEMISAVELVILALVLYPFIPESVEIGSITFPSINVYYMIMILLSIGFINYILVKKYQKYGIYFFSIFGALASSEATSSNLASLYRRTDGCYSPQITRGVMMTNISMAVRNSVIVLMFGTLNDFSLFNIYMIMALIVSIIGIVDYIYDRNQQKVPTDVELNIDSPLSYKHAIKFTIVFVIVSLGTLIIQSSLTDTGMIIASIFGGIASASAIVFTSASLYVNGTISLSIASMSVIAGTVMSFINKIIYTHIESRDISLTKNITKGIVKIASISIIYAIIIYILFM